MKYYKIDSQTTKTGKYPNISLIKLINEETGLYQTVSYLRNADDKNYISLTRLNLTNKNFSENIVKSHVKAKELTKEEYEKELDILLQTLKKELI